MHNLLFFKHNVGAGIFIVVVKLGFLVLAFSPCIHSSTVGDKAIYELATLHIYYAVAVESLIINLIRCVLIGCRVCFFDEAQS